MYDESGNPLPEDPWSSIVDLMSALVLVLFLAVIFFVSNYSEVTEALDTERSTLRVRTEELNRSRADVMSLNVNLTELKRREQALSARSSALESEKQALLGDKERLLAEREALTQDKITLDAERAALLKDKERLERDREALLGDKNRLIADQSSLKSKNNDLDAQVASLQAQLKELKERQQRAMSSLDDAFKKANAHGVSVDREGGKVVMKSEVLFDTGEAALSPQGMNELKAVSRGLSAVLNDPNYRDMIEGVMVEGHTSSEGPSVNNRALSAERALAALNFLLEQPEASDQRERYEALFFAGAFGEGRPVRDARGREQSVQSRRIELRILFNQADTQRLTDDLSKLK